jgi:hypothetical protein
MGPQRARTRSRRIFDNAFGNSISAMLPSRSRRRQRRGLSRELYSEALYQLRNTAGIHLKFTATTKLTQNLRLRLSYSSEVNEFPERNSRSRRAR